MIMKHIIICKQSLKQAAYHTAMIIAFEGGAGCSEQNGKNPPMRYGVLCWMTAELNVAKKRDPGNPWDRGHVRRLKSPMIAKRIEIDISYCSL